MGEGPGGVEDDYGCPLIGPSGQLLDKATRFIIGLAFILFSLYLLFSFIGFFFTGGIDQSPLDPDAHYPAAQRRPPGHRHGALSGGGDIIFSILQQVIIIVKLNYGNSESTHNI